MCYSLKRRGQTQDEGRRKEHWRFLGPRNIFFYLMQETCLEDINDLDVLLCQKQKGMTKSSVQHKWWIEPWTFGFDISFLKVVYHLFVGYRLKCRRRNGQTQDAERNTEDSWAREISFYI